jgi:hypothetical protein
MVVGGIPLGIAVALDVAMIGIIIFALVEVVGIVAAGLVIWPGTLQAQLTQQLDVEGLKTFVPSFWRVLGFKAYLSIVVFWLIAFALSLVGLLLCVVGVIPAAALAHMAAQHLMVQHYKMYLHAGGKPIGAKSVRKKPAPPPESVGESEALDLD